MAYNEKMVDRVREIIALIYDNVEEKKMFSGMCFMVNDKMCVGVRADDIMARIDPEMFEAAIKKEGCMPMEMKGKLMKGFVFVNEAALKTTKQLNYWVQLALEYNPTAKSSKKKK